MQVEHPGSGKHSEHSRRNRSLKALKFQSLLLYCNHLIGEKTPDTVHRGTLLMDVQDVGREQRPALRTEASISFGKEAG